MENNVIAMNRKEREEVRQILEKTYEWTQKKLSEPLASWELCYIWQLREATHRILESMASTHYVRMEDLLKAGSCRLKEDMSLPM